MNVVAYIGGKGTDEVRNKEAHESVDQFGLRCSPMDGTMTCLETQDGMAIAKDKNAEEKNWSLRRGHEVMAQKPSQNATDVNDPINTISIKPRAGIDFGLNL